MSLEDQLIIASSVLVVLAAIALALGVGYFLGAGAGWLVFGFFCLLGAKTTNDMYRDIRNLK